MRSLGIALLLLLSACNGSTEILSSTGSGGSGSSGSGGADAGADAPVDAPPPPEGGAPDPGIVLCGGSPCASADHYCCDDATKATETCVSKIVSACGGLRRECDEAADCGSGQVCCIPPNQAVFIAYNTMCAASCAGDPLAYQVCKTTAECENGEACTSQLCHGEIIQSCGPLPQDRCQ